MVVYNWYELLYSFFIYTVIIPIALGLNRWKLLIQSERWVIAFLVVLLLDELMSVLCIALHIRNHFLYYIQTVAVLFCVAGVYNATIWPKQLLWRIAGTVSILIIIEVIFRVGFNHINSITLTISRLLPAIYAFFSLRRLFSTNTFYSLTLKPMLYIHIGFFIIGAFTAVNACFMSYFIETSLDLFFLFQNMSAIMSAVSFGFFSIGFWRAGSADIIGIR